MLYPLVHLHALPSFCNCESVFRLPVMARGHNYVQPCDLGMNMGSHLHLMLNPGLSIDVTAEEICVLLNRI